MNAVIPVAVLAQGVPEEADGFATGLALLAAVAVTMTLYCLRSAYRAYRLADAHEQSSK